MFNKVLTAVAFFQILALPMFLGWFLPQWYFLDYLGGGPHDNADIMAGFLSILGVAVGFGIGLLFACAFTKLVEQEES